ncbi:hypothetical protein ACPPVO_23640 [Dactylosporangium sp. McL0621]|uniref:hypothetical protein n=1 Tax=Dactylosporangium sp. McL0621 TaxID=3415678 RepID=UPI003CF4915F
MTQYPRVPRGLPMPAVPALHSTGDVYCAITTVDGSGRLADRSAVRVLGWEPGDRFDIAVHAGGARAVSTDVGRLRVAANGHLRLPSPTRHLLGIACGDRVLVVAKSEQNALLVYSMATVTNLLTQFEAPDNASVSP